MGKICVEITLDTDTGQYSVVECAPETPEEPGGQSFQSVEDAFAAAAQLLQAGGQGTGDMKAALQGGYDNARGQMGGGIKPPGGGMFGEG